MVTESILAPLDFREIFGRGAPLEVDLGCGDGTFLAALAAQNPAHDFLGVERLAGRWRGATRKIGEQRLTNARILRMEILHALQHLLPPGSVTVFHLLFPDPWPKRRHRSRRVFSEEFLRAAGRALTAHGELRIATDHAEYFCEMEGIARSAPGLFAREDVSADFLPATTFEERFRENGLPIHRFSLRKTSRGRR
ncbi:MAG: tRNA (guanine(46)-N(7))-methyltransferase TrmB [Chthoniobacterales bacterium]